MPVPLYEGPSMFGYDTDVLNRVAAISVHTSPLADLGSKDAGGMNVYVRELSCHIAQLGLPIDVFTRRADRETPEIQYPCDGVRVISITAGPPEHVSKNDLFQYLPDFAAEMALFALRDGVRYDVVHAHYWLSGWVAQLVKRYWSVPFSFMFHTSAHMKNAVSLQHLHETDQRSQIERKLVKLADSIIAGNPSEAADLIWRERADASKICTIPPGVDTDLFHPFDRAESRRQLGLAERDKVVAFVGRIDPIKGIDTLLAATQRMQEAVGESLVVLIIGGDLDASGEPTGALREVAQQIETLGISDSIRLIGAQPQNRLPIIYSAADVVCVPSRYESFGLVAVEAMACGVPVVASRAGGLIYTVEDGETGFLAPTGDDQAFAAAMLKILADPELRDELGRAASETAHRFSWDAIAQSIRHVYFQLASGHRANLCCDEEIYA